MKKHKIVPMIEKLEFSLNRVARKFCRRRKKNFCHAVDGTDGNNPNPLTSQSSHAQGLRDMTPFNSAIRD